MRKGFDEKRLVIASHNSGKVREMRDLLAPFGVEAISASELGLSEPEETGETFAENAAIKARAAAHAANLPALADDSGLCVAALDNAPGICSARFAAEHGGFQGAMAALISQTRARGAARPWRAHFVCVLALAYPNGDCEIFEEKIEGELVDPPRGAQGFGYDPIFLPEGRDRTFGEMDMAEKHSLPADGSRALSHRARAFQAFARARLKKTGS